MTEFTNDAELDDMVNKLAKNVNKNKQESYSKDFIPDYYKIIGVSSKDSHEDIVSKCNEVMAKHHPDRFMNKIEKLPKDEQKKAYNKHMIQYNLVREATSVLKSKEKRKFYDMQKKTADSKTFLNSKTSFDEFKKLQETEMTKENKERAELTYNSKSAEMDKKHGFDTNQKYSINSKDFGRRFEDLRSLRDQQDADYMPRNMFGNVGFDPKTFNKNWEKTQKKKETKKSTKDNDRSIVQWDGIAAYGDVGANGGGYMEITKGDDAYEGLYKTSKEKDALYADILGSDDDNEDIDDITTDDDFDDIVEERDTIASYNKMMSEREFDEEKFGDRTFDNYKSVKDNPFNMSHQMGEIIGEDITQKRDKKTRKEIYEAYKALTFDKK